MDMKELDLDLMRSMIGSARGKRGSADTNPANLSYVRDLNAADMEFILNPPPLGSTTPYVKRLRTQHHHLARLMSQGIHDNEVARITGYSISRVSILKQDPAFTELVTYYKSQADAQFVDVHHKLAGLGEAAVEELQERLEEDPTQFKTGDLLKIGEFALDRSTGPPKSRAGDTGTRKIPVVQVSFHTPQGDTQLTITQDQQPMLEGPAGGPDDVYDLP